MQFITVIAEISLEGDLMVEFTRKGGTYTHTSGTFRIRERKGRAYEVEYADRPSMWISTGCRDFDEAVEKVKSTMHSARRYMQNEKVTLSQIGDGYFSGTGPGSFQERCKRFEKNHELRYFKQMDGRYHNYVRPRFGKMDVRDISSRLIEDWYIGITSYRHPGEEISSPTKLMILDVLNELMKEAMRKNLIDKNPCEDVQKVTVHKKGEREIFSYEEIALLFPNDTSMLELIWGSDMWALYFSIMLDTGFRPCEVAGLERSLIDENGAIYTAQEVDTPTRTLKKRIKTTGRGKGKKYGLLSRYTMDLLEEYLEDHDGEYLFIDYDGRFVSGNKVNDVLRRACWVVGIDIRERTSYCWRHTFDTHMMQSLGGNIKESDIHDLMGHTGYRPEYDHRTPQQIMFKMQKIRPAIEALRAGKDQNIV